MTGYFLPKDVFFCSRGPHFVFLDLEQDEYSIVSGEQSRALRVLLDESDGVTEDRGDTNPLEPLVAAGLLSKNSENHKSVAPTSLDVPTVRLASTTSEAEVPVRIRDIWHFAVACTTASICLRFLSIHRTVSRVRRLKSTRRALRSPPDEHLLRLKVGVFLKLRALFPANYLCLFDSLALMEFLARQRIFPTWVFAVRTDPWAAHCWVQDGRFLLNDDDEDIEEYSPVMTV